MIVIDRKSRAGATAPRGTSHDRIRNLELGSPQGQYPITRKDRNTAVTNDVPLEISRAGRDIPKASRTKSAGTETAPEPALGGRCQSGQL